MDFYGLWSCLYPIVYIWLTEDVTVHAGRVLSTVAKCLGFVVLSFSNLNT